MTQTLETLINTVAAEVFELQDTKADRIELHAYIRTANPEITGVDSSGNPIPQLVSLVKTGSVLSINTQNLRAVLAQIVPNPDICNIDLSNFINNVVADNDDPFQYLKITSDGQDLHVDYSEFLNHINTTAPGTSLSSYLRQVVNDTGDTAPTPLVQLTSPTVTDSSGNAIRKSVNINYSGLRTALSQKADAEVPQFFMNYYFRYPTQTSLNPTKST